MVLPPLLLNLFWSRWTKDYVLQLSSFHRVKSKKTVSVKLGDVVLIEGKGPRGIWTTGIIAETHPGRDGIVRACKVRIPNGQFLTRPVQKLYPLELAKSPGEDVIEVEDDEVRAAQ